MVEKRKDSFDPKGFRTTFLVIGARDTRQLEIFPLATTTVGWVPDQHTRRAVASRRTLRAAESCAGGLPTDNAAKGKTRSVKRASGSLARCEIAIYFAELLGAALHRCC